MRPLRGDGEGGSGGKERWRKERLGREERGTFDRDVIHERKRK